MGVKHDTEVKKAAKYAKYSRREGEFNKGYHLTKWCKTDKTQAGSEFAHESPFFMIFPLPWGSLRSFNHRKGSRTFDKLSELE